MKTLISAFVLALFFSTLANAEGPTRIIDGDTFEGIGRDGNTYRYRLWGIDAPESRDVCPDGYPAGAEATKLLRLMLANDIDCEEVDRDRYGRIVVLCIVMGRDVAAIMVEQGLAWDWPQYSKGRYSRWQDWAQAGRRGIWAHGC